MASAVLLSDPEASARRDEFVSRAMAALTARDLGAALELAEEAKKVGKEGSTAQLEALAAALGAQARAAASSADRAADVAVARHGLAIAAVGAARRERLDPARPRGDVHQDALDVTRCALEAMYIKKRST